MFTCNYKEINDAFILGSDHSDFADNEYVQYVTFQEEIGEDGTYHIQGFLQLSQSRAPSYLHSMCTRCHWNIANNPQKAKEYCQKDDATRVSVPFEYGTFTAGQGTRSDLMDIKKRIDNGETLLDIANDHFGSMVRYHKGLQWYQTVKQEKRPPVEEVEYYPWQEILFQKLEEEPVMRRILWIWSTSSGTGKTTTSKMIMNKYWGKVLIGSKEMKRTLYAYNNHRIIIFDCSRADPHDAHFLSQIEALSNQTCHLSEMFTPCMKTVISHIVIFSNRPPPIDKLPDRIVEFQVE